jgi:hypothetical protein
MAYERIMSRLPDLGKPVSVTSATTVTDLLVSANADDTAVIALVNPGSIDHLKLHKFDGRRAFFENLKGYLLEENAATEKVPTPHLSEMESEGLDRVVCLILKDGTIKPVKLVRSKYTTFQNSSVVSDALEFTRKSGSNTEIMTAGSHQGGELFSLTIGYEVLSTSIEGKEVVFNQYATLFTSHNSTQAYGIAYSIIGVNDKNISFWRVTKMRHTKKIEEHARNVKSSLLGLEKEGKSFIAEVEIMGKIRVEPSGQVMEDLLNLAAPTHEGDQKYKYDRRGWEKEKIAWHFKSTSVLYGENGWAFYQALNEFIFKYPNRAATKLTISKLRETHYEAQNRVKDYLVRLAVEQSSN